MTGSCGGCTLCRSENQPVNLSENRSIDLPIRRASTMSVPTPKIINQLTPWNGVPYPSTGAFFQWPLASRHTHQSKNARYSILQWRGSPQSGHCIVIKPMPRVAFNANAGSVLCGYLQAKKFTIAPCDIMTVTTRM